MKRHILTIVIIGLGTLLTSPVYSANLMQIYQQALISDPAFQAAGAKRLSETQNIPIARSFLLPQLFVANSFSAYNVQENKTQPLNSSIVGNPELINAFNLGTFKYNSNGYTINLSQVIFDYSAWSTFQQAKTTVKAANAAYAAAGQDLMARVSMAYFAVLFAEDQLRYIQAEKKAIYQQLDQVLQQYKVGLVAITGVYQAQAQYDRIIAQEIEAKNNIINAKENLRAITGIFYENLDGLKPNIPLLPPEPTNVNEWVAMGQRMNWSLQTARYEAEVAQQQIKINFSGHMPTINAFGQQELTRTGSTPGGKVNDKTSSVGIQLALPAYQGGLVNAGTKQARYSYAAAMDNQEKQSRNTINLVHQSYNNITNGISKIKADQRAIISGESSLRSTIEAYKVGTQTMLDVLISQQDLFDTFRIYANDQYDYINAIIALKEAAGTLNVSDLEEINQMLTATENTFSYLSTKQLNEQSFNYADDKVPPKDLIGKKGLNLKDISSINMHDLGLNTKHSVLSRLFEDLNTSKTDSKKIE